jgi:peptidoglycan hydrolase-like protein with peptidoglycan-binding domain
VYTGLLQPFAVPVALFAALAIGAWAGAPSPQTTTSTTKKKKSVAKSPAKSTLKTAPKTSTSAAKSKSKRPAVAVHRAPQQPSPDRLKEIQQALAGRGYFSGEPTGSWGPTSIDALKRFQHDQKLVEDGKIGSLSLIALGLGPKREPGAEPEQKTP